MEIKHSTTANPNDIVASANWNANHIMDDITTSVNVTFVGTLAGSGNTGNETTLVGYRAGVDNPANNLTAVGAWAGDTSSGIYNSFFGWSSGWENTGVNVSALGSSSAGQNKGDYCSFIGDSSGYQNLGDRTTGLGDSAAFGNTADDIVAIGYFAGKNNATANQFILKQTNINAVPLIQGDFSTGNVAIGKTSAGSKLGVAGLPIFANNAAAIVGGLVAGDFYRTGADPDPLMVVH